MLLYHLNWVCNGILLLMVLAIGCAIYAYYVNSRRPKDDPKKRNYHPLAIILAPITLPIFVVLYLSFFIVRVVTYGVFLALSILALILLPKSSAPTWFDEMATGIGQRLLEINTFLVRFFLKPGTDESEKI